MEERGGNERRKREEREERLVKKIGSRGAKKIFPEVGRSVRVALKFTRYVLGIPLGLMILTSPNTGEATDAPRIN